MVARKSPTTSTLTLGACLALAIAVSPSMAEEPPHFETDVRPIFKALCFHCHGEGDELSGGLDLRLARLLREGGDSGEAISGQSVDDSLLWQRIEFDEMPEGAKKLTPEQKRTIRKWIAAGAPTRRDEPDNPDDAKYTLEELSHWSFQPVKEFAVPEVDSGIVHTPIDAFVLDRLNGSSLVQSPQTSKAVLLRRVAFDLTGLPPTPDELDAFLDDDSHDAYEKAVDRLLASPHFGIRWGRHWLDVAGYSETDGFLANDIFRPHAWRYRDYVIESINADKPYDQFIQEQVAGDEMIAESGAAEPDAQNERHVELLTATGFLQMAPDLTARQNSINDRNQVIAETIKIVSSSVLGMTVGCAQCHDHRYDPVSAEDYYALRAVFDPAFPLNDWKQPEQRLVDLTPSRTLKEIERIETIAQQREVELQEQKLKFSEGIYQRLVDELPEEHRVSLTAAAAKSEADRTADETKLLEQFPMFASAETIAGKLAVYDSGQHKKFFEQENEIKAFRQSGPSRRRVMCAGESGDEPPGSAVLARGDPLSPKQSVAPAEVFVLAQNRQTLKIPVNVEALPTTGRRLAYARQLTDGTHPTVARVAVNRIWKHHFGVGLVASTSDFGLSGQQPSHPKLLDWLADDFVRNGWQMKRLHKMIVMSHTFRQSSRRVPKADQVDPDNRLLSRMSLRRLDAEEIRDAMLMVTGLINWQSGGPSVPVATRPDGRTVIGETVLNEGGLFGRIDDVGQQKYRRSIYIANRRTTLLTMLDTFDAPAMTPNCDARQSSTVAPQSLWFLNDDLIRDQTEKVANQMFGEAFPNAEARVRFLYRRTFSSEPADDEMQQMLAYLEQQADVLRQYEGEDWRKKLDEFPHAADVAAHATLCQALLSTNRFLYVE